MKKARELMELEEIEKAALFVFSINGFHANAVEYMKSNGIAWTSDRRWLEESNDGRDER